MRGRRRKRRGAHGHGGAVEAFAACLCVCGLVLGMVASKRRAHARRLLGIDLHVRDAAVIRPLSAHGKAFETADLSTEGPAVDALEGAQQEDCIGALSVGRPNAGTILGACQLPLSRAYTRLHGSIAWGSAATVSHVTHALHDFRRRSAYVGQVMVGSLSRQGGGVFLPHRSHQSGRDVDIWLPTLSGAYAQKLLPGSRGRPTKAQLAEIDWHATWHLVRALVDTGGVQMIFLDERYQPFLYRGAIEAGASDIELETYVQWPRTRGEVRTLLRHCDDHLGHIHVRFRCEPGNALCFDATTASSRTMERP